MAVVEQGVSKCRFTKPGRFIKKSWRDWPEDRKERGVGTTGESPHILPPAGQLSRMAHTKNRSLEKENLRIRSKKQTYEFLFP